MFESTTLRESTLVQEGPLLVSKALKFPVLLDAEEMRDLFQVFEKENCPCEIYYAQGVCKRGEGKIAKSYFLQKYQEYCSLLKRGESPQLETFRPLFSSFWSVTPDILYAIPLEDQAQLIKAIRPVFQLQLNHIHYSEEDGEFRPMAFGKDSISWGIQFSYPQLFQDAKTQEIHPVRDSPLFPNTILFKIFQKWMRSATLPTPFIVHGKKKISSIRLGKKCFSWIDNHPHLKEKGIQVDAVP